MIEKPAPKSDPIYAELERRGLAPKLEPLGPIPIFHGTTLNSARNIISEGFHPSGGQEDNANLHGYAVYAWLSDASYRGHYVAKAWAEYKLSSRPFTDETPAVVGATLKCDRAFNPASKDNLLYFRTAYQLVIQFFRSRGDSRMHTMDEHLVLDFLHRDVPVIRDTQVLVTRFGFKPPQGDNDYPSRLIHPGLVIYDRDCIVNAQVLLENIDRHDKV